MRLPCIVSRSPRPLRTILPLFLILGFGGRRTLPPLAARAWGSMELEEAGDAAEHDIDWFVIHDNDSDCGGRCLEFRGSSGRGGRCRGCEARFGWRLLPQNVSVLQGVCTPYVVLIHNDALFEGRAIFVRPPRVTDLWRGTM
jgi:hypothetical protein